MESWSIMPGRSLVLGQSDHYYPFLRPFYITIICAESKRLLYVITSVITSLLHINAIWSGSQHVMPSMGAQYPAMGASYPADCLIKMPVAGNLIMGPARPLLGILVSSAHKGTWSTHLGDLAPSTTQCTFKLDCLPPPFVDSKLFLVDSIATWTVCLCVEILMGRQGKATR